MGLRKFYGGDPDFLDVLTYDEPLAAREGRRRYVVIMDRVPGGTGLLAELCVGKGAKLKEALEKAHDLLQRCPCQTRVPAVRACYQCLYAYREGQDLPLLERVRALEIVERLLDGFGALAKVDTIGTMTQSGVLESELEARFVRQLEARVTESHGTWTREDEGTWRLAVGGRRWLLGRRVGAERLATLRAQRGSAGIASVLDAVFGEGFGPTDVFRAWWGAAEDLKLAATVAAFRHRLIGPTGVRTAWQHLQAVPDEALSRDEVWVYGCELLRELRRIELQVGPDTKTKEALLADVVTELGADLARLAPSARSHAWLSVVSRFYGIEVRDGGA